jgi:hypothetical protein
VARKTEAASGQDPLVRELAEARRIQREADGEVPPGPPRRALAIASFEHDGRTYKIGDICSTNDLVVGQVNHCFVLMED